MKRLTAAEIGIRPKEYEVLIGIRDDLDSGHLVHLTDRNIIPNLYADNKKVNTRLFNMNYWTGHSACGTSHCIGGFMELRGAFKSTDAFGWSKPLHPLFYPEIMESDWEAFTAADAIRAIDYFLAGYGGECWGMAMLESA